jgi:hypothetical protein
MTERTYSQKIARVFEIVDYFLLFPAGIGALFGLSMIQTDPLYSVLLYGFLTVGIILLIGYFKHSRGTLDDSHFSALWITSAVYNFILFLPALYLASNLLQKNGLRDYEGRFSGGRIFFFLIVVTVVFSYVAAITSSIKAYSFEKRKNISRSQLSILNP